MADQLGLFDAPPAAGCEHHGPGNVCEFCPERFDADHSGFVHMSVCKGRHPLRMCARCLNMVTPGRWNHADWWHCIDCQPLGTMSEKGRPVWEALQRAEKSRRSA